MPIRVGDGERRSRTTPLSVKTTRRAGGSREALCDGGLVPSWSPDEPVAPPGAERPPIEAVRVALPFAHLFLPRAAAAATRWAEGTAEERPEDE